VGGKRWKSPGGFWRNRGLLGDGQPAPQPSPTVARDNKNRERTDPLPAPPPRSSPSVPGRKPAFQPG
jgi:hypothetical protein